MTILIDFLRPDLNGASLGCVNTKNELIQLGNEFLFLKLYNGKEYLRTVKYINKYVSD